MKMNIKRNYQALFIHKYRRYTQVRTAVIQHNFFKFKYKVFGKKATQVLTSWPEHHFNFLYIAPSRAGKIHITYNHQTLQVGFLHTLYVTCTSLKLGPLILCLQDQNMNATSAACCGDEEEEDEDGEAADMEGIHYFCNFSINMWQKNPEILCVFSEYEESGLLETDEVCLWKRWVSIHCQFLFLFTKLYGSYENSAGILVHCSATFSLPFASLTAFIYNSFLCYILLLATFSTLTANALLCLTSGWQI